MVSRDRYLGFAALAVGADFFLGVAEHVVRLANLLGELHRGEFVVAECLEILQFAVLVLAAASAAWHFLGDEKGRQGLRDAALLGAAAYGFAVVAGAFQVAVYGSEPNIGAFRTASVLDCALFAVLVTFSGAIVAIGDGDLGTSAAASAPAWIRLAGTLGRCIGVACAMAAFVPAVSEAFIKSGLHRSRP